MLPETIDRDRLDELRQALARLDPEGRKSWRLEYYERDGKEERLIAVIDLKTGCPLRPQKKREE